MFKKLLIAGAVLAVTSGTAFANGSPYLGFSVGQKTNTSTYFNFRGVPADLFIGYGAMVGQGFYLAGEVLANVVTVNVSNNGLRSTYGYAASFIPGLLLSDHTMGFARLGLIRSHFEPADVSSKTVSGVQLGIGLQTNLMQNWDLRGEYDYDAYSSLSGVQGNPRSDEFNMGLVYKFD